MHARHTPVVVGVVDARETHLPLRAPGKKKSYYAHVKKNMLHAILLTLTQTCDDYKNKYFTAQRADSSTGCCDRDLQTNLSTFNANHIGNDEFHHNYDLTCAGIQDRYSDFYGCCDLPGDTELKLNRDSLRVGLAFNLSWPVIEPSSHGWVKDPNFPSIVNGRAPDAQGCIPGVGDPPPSDQALEHLGLPNQPGAR